MDAAVAEISGVRSPSPPNLAAIERSADGTLSKGQFAELINVSPGRISQYISEGKLTGAALVGEGRSQRILVEEAKRQLKRHLDISQRLGNGINTRLDPSPQPAPPQQQPASPPLVPPVDSTEEQIKRARLAGIEFDNRKKAEEEAARAGRYTPTDDVTQQLGRVAGAMLTAFDGMIAEMATAVAANFKLPARDVVHLMRGEFRKSRAAAAAAAKDNAAGVPPLLEDERDAEADQTNERAPAAEEVPAE